MITRYLYLSLKKVKYFYFTLEYICVKFGTDFVLIFVITYMIINLTLCDTELHSYCFYNKKVDFFQKPFLPSYLPSFLPTFGFEC